MTGAETARRYELACGHVAENLYVVPAGTMMGCRYRADGTLASRVTHYRPVVRKLRNKPATPTAGNPKRGMRFLSAHQITKDSTARDPKPETCEVTRVTATTVFFRNSTGFRSRIARDKFPGEVREVLP